MELPIKCSHSQVWEIEKLMPHPRNPNTHPDEQIRLLSKILASQGWRLPITVSERSGFITRGHGRLQAARLLGLTHVPVDLQGYDSDDQELTDMLADNAIQELSEMDRRAVKELLVDLDTGAIDVELTGLPEAKIEKLMLDAPPPPKEKLCPHCGKKI